MSTTDPSELESVTETKQFSSSQLYEIDSALNAYLGLGWRIINQWKVGNGELGESQHLEVLLGWQQGDGPAPHPELGNDNAPW